MRVSCVMVLRSWRSRPSRPRARSRRCRTHTAREYKDELVRPMTPAPAGAFVVREDGAEVPYQVEAVGGKDWVWVCSDFAPRATHHYRVEPGAPAPRRRASVHEGGRLLPAGQRRRRGEGSRRRRAAAASPGRSPPSSSATSGSAGAPGTPPCRCGGSPPASSATARCSPRSASATTSTARPASTTTSPPSPRWT